MAKLVAANKERMIQEGTYRVVKKQKQGKKKHRYWDREDKMFLRYVSVVC